MLVIIFKVCVYVCVCVCYCKAPCACMCVCVCVCESVTYDSVSMIHLLHSFSSMNGFGFMFCL